MRNRLLVNIRPMHSTALRISIAIISRRRS